MWAKMMYDVSKRGAEKAEHDDVECTHSKIIKRDHEIVCRDCGLVISELEFETATKHETFRLWDYTSFANTADRLTSRERTELTVAIQIEIVASKLLLPKWASAQAVVEARKILRRMRVEGKVRLKAKEVAIASLWSSCKIVKALVSIRDYAEALKMLGFDYDEDRIYRLLNRASKLMDLPCKPMQPKDYIPKITAKLVGRFEQRYLSAVERYAVTIATHDRGMMRGRNPVYLAAASICAADEILGGRIGSSVIMEVIGAGAGLTNLSSRLMFLAPKPPAEVFDLIFASVHAKRMSLLAEG